MPRKSKSKGKRSQDRRRDCMGLVVTCKDDTALAMYDKALYALVRLDNKLISYTHKALELDGSFVLVNCIMVSVVDL